VKYDISEFEKRVEQGYLRKSEKYDLVLYGYTDACTFDRAWDDHTKTARGLILNKTTGELVAKPFPKFFNLGEMAETFLTNLPDVPYKAYEKKDGSLGIIFNYKGEWNISTRGSFYSDQAVKGAELLKKYDFSKIPEDLTVLVEIIYPQNKIIVNYGEKEALVLLGAFWRTSTLEVHHDYLEEISKMSGLEMAKSYDYTIEQMIALQETLPKDEEGFVVRYSNGLRVKIKGKEYLRIAKLISSLSPIALWETMKNGKVDTFYLQQLPEELRIDYEPYVSELERQYKAIISEIIEDIYIHNLGEAQYQPNWRKSLGLYLVNNKVRHGSAMFSYYLKNTEALDKYVMKQIRPNGNNMKTV
jgi:RNA ligase